MPAIPSGIRGARFTGWGTAVGRTVVTNFDLMKTLDTSDEWIRERTGIVQRNIGGTNLELSTESGSKALKMAGVDPASIDALVLATTTPDRPIPATSSSVQNALGLRCGAFDVNAACSGFVYGLINAHGLIAMGAERVLLIGTDILSRATDWTDRNTAILFADASGAAVLEQGPGQLLGWDIDSDGSLENLLYQDYGDYIKMDGKEVFRRAVRIMVDSATKSLKHAGITADDLALVVPHQANIRIVQSATDKLGIPMDKAAMVIEHAGNTSSASIPLALFTAVEHGRVKPGDKVLLVGFGAGMTAASAIIEWGGR